MEETYVIFGLPLFTHLLRERSQQLATALSQVRYEDVRSEQAIANTVARLRRQFELLPVTFEEPRIVGDEEVSVNLTPGQGLLGFHSKAYQVQVQYTFAGSPELLRYVPQGVSFGGNTRVYAPSYGSVIDVLVQVTRLEKNLAINAAEEKMQATRSLAAATTSPARDWNTLLDQEIQQGLERRKNDLDGLYG